MRLIICFFLICTMLNISNIVFKYRKKSVPPPLKEAQISIRLSRQTNLTLFILLCPKNCFFISLTWILYLIVNQILFVFLHFYSLHIISRFLSVIQNFIKTILSSIFNILIYNQNNFFFTLILLDSDLLFSFFYF